MDRSPTTTADRFSRFCATLQSADLRAALAEQLLLTDYRFIAIFRFKGERATAALFYDRNNPDVLRADEVPASATYCVFARETEQPFVTDDAIADERLVGHVAREQVRSYCGVPILTPEGEILGTLCHYDLVPRDARQIDLALMCEIASALEQRNLVPPYPAQA